MANQYRFTDDDLRAYKYRCPDNTTVLGALLIRLEAAERVCNRMTNGAILRYSRMAEAYEAWRKAAKK